MARIRTIKPEFWSDERTGPLSDFAKCLFLGMLNLADDYGVVEYRPMEWRAKLFPYRDGTTPVVVEETIVGEILPSGIMEMFSLIGDDGRARRYLFITNFCKHQVVNKPSKPLIDGWKKGDNPSTYADRTEADICEVSAPGKREDGTTTGVLPEHSFPERKGRERTGNNLPPTPLSTGAEHSEPAPTAVVDGRNLETESDEPNPIANLSPADRAMVAVWRATGATEDQIAGWLVTTRGPNRDRIAGWLKTIPAEELPGIVTAILDRAEDRNGDLRDSDGKPILSLWAYLGKAIPAEWSRRQTEARTEAASHDGWTPPKVPWEQRAMGLRKGHPWQPMWGRVEQAPDFVQQAYRDGQAAQHRSAAQ